MANIIGEKIKDISELYKGDIGFSEGYIDYIGRNFNIDLMPMEYINNFTRTAFDFTPEEYSLQDLLFEYSNGNNMEIAIALKMNFSEIKDKLTELDTELKAKRIEVVLSEFKQNLISYDCLKHIDSFDALEFIAYIYLSAIMNN